MADPGSEERAVSKGLKPLKPLAIPPASRGGLGSQVWSGSPDASCCIPSFRASIPRLDPAPGSRAWTHIAIPSISQLNPSRGRTYEQFIVGDDIAIITVTLTAARVCDVNDSVRHWSKADGLVQWTETTKTPPRP